MKKIIIVLFINCSIIYSQTVPVPVYLHKDNELTNELTNIVKTLDLYQNFDVGEDGIEQISLAVIDLTSPSPLLGGVNPDNFIYPASVYKMYVAAEVLSQISQGKYDLNTKYVAGFPNIVDRSKEIENDPRPLLKEQDTVTINYLLDLMITRSDNSAANCLIDVAGRKNIDSLLHKLGWYGSEVTRKFLKRKYEDSGYVNIRGTETCALHAADFLYRVYTNQLVNPWVSMQLKTFLGRQLDNTKLSAGLPKNTMFYHKTGWFSFWTNDVGIVDNGTIKYIISCFLPLEQEKALPKFKALSAKIYQLISNKE
jgi:beta-lactamase class A